MFNHPLFFACRGEIYLITGPEDDFMPLVNTVNVWVGSKYCSKFNKDFKNGPHQKKKKLEKS